MKQVSSRLNSVEKALKILLSFCAEQSSWGVREMSSHLQLSPATVQRLLQTLKHYGFVDQDPDTRQYRLGTVYFRFLDTLQSTYPIVSAALPFMKRLLARTQETVHLNVVDGTERVCLEHMESPQQLKAGMPVGNRSPLYAGASSKCLLAYSPAEFIETYLRQCTPRALTENTIISKNKLAAEISRTKKRGYAVSLGERTPGLGSLSAPILNHNGTILAALSLALPELRFRNNAHRALCLKELCAAAVELSRGMGHHG